MRKFRFVIFLIMIAFACVGMGGCGGSNGPLNNSSNDAEKALYETVIIYNNLTEDDTPNIFEFEGVPEKSYAANSVISGEIISVPSRTYLKRLNSVINPDSFIMNLTQGIEYTVEISKGNFYQYPIGSNLPDIEIINPKGNELDFLDLGEAYDVSNELILSDDVIELSVYPEENPYIICLTLSRTI